MVHFPEIQEDGYETTHFVADEKEYKKIERRLHYAHIPFEVLFTNKYYHNIELRISQLPKFYRIYTQSAVFQRPKDYINPLQSSLHDYF